MKVAIDISPLKTGHFLQHRVRGTGVYLENLRSALERYHPEHSYQFFSRGESVAYDTDIVHYPYFEPFFLTLPFRKKIKTVVTVHDLTPFVFPKQFPSGLKGNLKWKIQKWNLKKVDAIITDSESSKKDIVRFTGFDSSKVFAVYLASEAVFKKRIVSQKEKNLFKEKYHLPDSFALYVGDVTWNKNLPRLLHAVQKAQIPLVMVGKALIEKDFDRANPWNQDLTKVQELIKKERCVISPGFIPTEDLIKFYNSATFFIMPSLYEGFGLPILEAMSCGCPVITSKEGSLAEVAGDAALYVSAYDVESITSGMKKLFDDHKLQESLSQKSLERAKHFTWEKTAKETVSVYEKILGSK